MRRSVFVATALALAACNDFAPPAELMTATVVGIRAEPPVVGRGQETTLTPLIASPQGPGDPAGGTWTLTETLPGVPPFGQLTSHPDGTATYRAPDELPELPANALPLDSVQLQITLEGRTTSTLKAVLVADVVTENPAVAAVSVDGVALSDAADATLEVSAGAAVELAVTIAPAATDSARYAWYASLGSLEQYQSAACTYLAEEPGTGWLFVVVRDGQLGITWRALRLVAR